MSLEPKALRLARYLKEFVGLRSTTVLDVNKYDTVLWFGDMPQEPECQSPVWNEELSPDQPWLIVRKQQLPTLPLPPEIIRSWIDEALLRQPTPDMPGLMPTKMESDPDALVADGEEPPLIERHLRDYPDVKDAYARYRPIWEAWSKEHRRRSHIQFVYADLFRLHTQLQKEGEIVELVLGLGLLSWRNPSRTKSASLLRHVVTARVNLRFDPANGTMQLDGADGPELRIEDDMLEGELRPDRTHYTSIAEQLSAIGEDIWDRSKIIPPLRTWATAIHPDCDWSPDLKPAMADGDRPLMSFAPALILRKRTQAGMKRVYNDLIVRMMRSPEEAPAGWNSLVDDEDDRDQHGGQAAESGSAKTATAPGETYFPLPANREQRRIAEAINRCRGVLVQGPPGTGKSHTIANLVCHLLATGKRVLITAETGRALKVLKEKLPAEIQPLCVSVLGHGGEAFAELNAAVEGITNRYAQWRPGAYDRRIADIDRELDARRRMLAQNDADLRALREDETCPHVLMNGSYQGSASAIAARVSAERAQFGWVALPRDAAEVPPVTKVDIAAWLRVRRRDDHDAIAKTALKIVSTSKLMSAADFAVATATEREARQAVDALGTLRSHPAYPFIMNLKPKDRTSLAECLRLLNERWKSLRCFDYAYDALRATMAGRQARWLRLFQISQQQVAVIEQFVDGLATVAIPANRDLNAVQADVAALIRHLKSSGKLPRFGLLAPKPIRGCLYLRDEVTVDGQPPATFERLLAVHNYITVARAFKDLEQAWETYGGLPERSAPSIYLAAIREHVGSLDDALSCADACLSLHKTLNSFAPGIPGLDWAAGEAEDWLAITNASAVEERLRNASEVVTSCLRELKPFVEVHDSHPVISVLIQAIEQRDVAAYSQAVEAVRNVEEAQRDQQARRRTEAALSAAVPGLIEAVETSLDNTAWDERFAQWDEAWRWAVADNWLQKRADSSYREELHQRRTACEQEMRDLLSETAGLRAWTHFFNRLSPRESAALRGWREAVKALGKGTGRSARTERLRWQVRDYMNQCREAIPIWIMPRYLVAEMVDAAPNRFDLVIVDEASQLGIESLFLFYIAKKMIVVGDDQQISPYGVGIPDDAIANLQRHFLDGIPHQAALTAQSSFYANAKIRFGESIVLREHFRCMPEIIQFSNDLCYANNGTPLDPLRAYPANRLKPLVLRHIPHGYRSGGVQHATNEPEADAIVAQIQACIADTRYDGCTMGVVSLQGETQAKLIEHKLLEAIDPEVIEERRLICGDAYAFQGDERHIIFLSMVAAPGEIRIGALSSISAVQRFNVAASRAQDQLWLFHTPTLDHLSPVCMRHRLLEYMLNPSRQVPQPSDQHFDSAFERDVFQMITEKGFHVRTQVCVGDPVNHRYRIDLVVEGMQGRLAVECDGDRWHGPESYERDMARQRDLERAGWQFVRIRGGDFYRDRTRALEPLWSELNRLGIKAGGVDEAAAEPPAPRPSPSPKEVEDPPAVKTADAESVSATPCSVEAYGTDEATAPTTPEIEALPRTLVLADYVCFEGPPGPDPRTVPTAEVTESLCRIIEVEGPMLAKRAFEVYSRSCGIQRMRNGVKSALITALTSAIRQGLVLVEYEEQATAILSSTVRMKGSPAVKLRQRGPRSFEEIPASEIRFIAQQVLSIVKLDEGADEHLRTILFHLGLSRLTSQVRSRLNQILADPISPPER
jgi:very-short-patch-repair endonuclease